MFQNGGTILCPYCGLPNVLGAQHPQQHVYHHVAPPPPAQQPAAASNESSKKVVLVVLAAFAAIGIATSSPGFGLVVGILAGGGAIGYLAAPKFREFVDRLGPSGSSSNWRRLGLAAATLLWSFMLVFAAITGHETRKDEAATAERAKEAAAAKADADREVRDGLLASARQKLGAGDLDGAQADLTAAGSYEAVPEMATLSEELAAGLHERDLQRLPGLLTNVQAHNAAKEWSAALGECTRARAIDAQYPGLDAACAAATEGERLAAIPGWIDTALAVASDANRCDTPLEIADAWKNLRQVKPSDADYAKARTAATKLEKCRKKSERIFSTGIRDIMVNQRVQWAEDYERSLLDEGMDVRVSLSGKYKNHAKIRWVLLSRVSVHQIVEDGTFLAALEKIGFQKVTFSDGFYESWVYELDPQSEEGGGKKVLEGLGLDQPLSL
jgi:hypothetical protein